MTNFTNDGILLYFNRADEQNQSDQLYNGSSLIVTTTHKKSFYNQLQHVKINRLEWLSKEPNGWHWPEYWPDPRGWTSWACVLGCAATTCGPEMVNKVRLALKKKVGHGSWLLKMSWEGAFSKTCQETQKSQEKLELFCSNVLSVYYNASTPIRNYSHLLSQSLCFDPRCVG